MGTIDQQSQAGLEGQTPPPVLEHSEAGITTLTLNNPARLNILTQDMLEHLLTRLEALRDGGETRVIILAANGKAFCAGHDLKVLRGGDPADVEHLFSTCTRLMELLWAYPKPVIAQVQGNAVAAGCQLVASCDIVMAAQGTHFGATGIHAGLFCSTPMVPLSRVVPEKKALEMLLTGDMLTAQAAQEIGLVNHVPPPEELERATQEMARRIAAHSPFAIRLGKEAFRRQKDQELNAAYRIGQEAMVRNILSEDGQEGISAFLEKRPPKYRP